LKREKKSCVLVARSLNTWPETARIRKEEQRGNLFLKINLKY